MAQKISEMTKTQSLSGGNELIEIVQSGKTKSCDIDQIQTRLESNNLNADKLDGFHESSFFRDYQGSRVLNNLYLTDDIYLYKDVNDGFAVRVGESGAYKYITFDPDGKLYISGQIVWYAGNDGAGSGLDADTVDGLASSQFLRNDQSGSINGSITSKQLDVTTSQTNLNVSNCNSIEVNTTSGDVTISGLTSGSGGQILAIIKSTLANNLIIEHNEGDGDQNIYTRDTTDISLSGYGGVILICNGNHWFETGR